MIKQFQFITSYQGWVSALRSQVSFYLDRKFSPFPAQVTALHHHPVAGASGKFVASSLALNAFNIASHTGQSEGRALLKQPIGRKVKLDSITPFDHHKPRVIYDAGATGTPNTELG